MSIVQHLINGELVSKGERTADVFNPSTGQAVRKVELASRATVQEAIDSAKAAFPAWRNTPPAKRAQVMFRFKQLLEQNEAKISQMISEEHGKTLEDAAGELKRGIENVEFACAAPEVLKGEYSRNVGPNIDAWSDFQPLGVVAGITPFNFPAMVPLWMYPLAIACGNAFILKPSERDPSSTLYIAQLLLEAGLPKGILNVVHGDKEAVDALIEAPEVKALSFVGSTPIAEYIYAEGTKRGKRVQALGGAKNHAVVMPDADLDNAVSALMGAAYGSCGERCMAISVAVCVGDQAADALIAKLEPQIRALKIGAGTSCGLDMGPLVTAAARDKVLGYIDDGVASGAKLVVDGRDLRVAGCEDGYFVGGTLFDNVSPEMRIYKEEIFGPVLCVVRVDSLEQAMQLINDHEYGNGTCIFTRDGEAARLFCDEIEVGMVGVNVPLPVPVAYHSFGGWKRSLFGDLHAYGPDGVRFYTRRKAITQRWPQRKSHEASQFAFPSL
ncbi:malonate-semialdehyde dehydrogenase (acetylating)/methylmalonate-semialdehyde dehydrogenase [Pseudomonas sp. BIGb0278]|mgnify:CR=1 FL=1|jgi:malonate-semialdehyde dehydrogenase (acetylating)/methylmalonate-semialdehyde dehydrogenase|uniref:methylmalonate-semialdehyde dehydrogenase (CoA acylating) n=1 Tax=Pseudomonas fluorescens TaxID=294 RepID=A0A5E6VZP8_PSEFL|nr:MULTISPECIES: CoA-acylating methylmalonate-semialdehyde dehydrogenase [Pseudomonas]AUF94779.1 methylmalonate-semialdehyde dehydrogenase (CoA acylating) [Pseudomonas sp. 02C 26]MBA1199489.1 CoA-acylating methylmalonate-semialdehyde dehydrogenase [Pseudomonas plecoglossicida]MBA1322015.1 CoA-acylating methylmalonate-semialdehyde dehydrogenase [Pseudomonas plecoglossicida]MCS4283478.1 malonate-semialdehyde dehydrogenase (acetylating)/methylmalonate-semialdehyde dehydrogenase [Pseudomonas sp. BI